MPGVALLSEVNPASVKLFPSFDPMYQDITWLHLLTKEDREHFSRLELGEIENFRELIQIFYDRATARERQLVIRDYNYVEFIGIPFRTDPPKRLMLYAALPRAIPTASVALIRHPIDQWLSLCKHQGPDSGISPWRFCDAYDTFLRELGTTALFKYEELIDNPQDQLLAICRELGLHFASSFRERFHQFDGVTGDLTRMRDQSISAPVRKFMPRDVLAEFRSSDGFRTILRKTGYSDFISTEEA